MKSINSVNEFVIRFANTNGTGSASANNMFAKAVFRMGIPVSPRNVFPSNIQGMPTWFDVRVSDKGYLARREGGSDIVVAMNSQSMVADVEHVLPGGYFLYDSTKEIDPSLMRKDITFLGMPISEICLREYTDPRQRQLFKNVIYVGALAALLDMDFDILKGLISDQFRGKEKLIAPNVHALELGYQQATTRFNCPLSITLKSSDQVGSRILIDGNTAAGLGAVYGGATVAGWYPITPSTSVVENYEKYCERLRIDPATGKKNFAVMQAEDELAAIGIAIGGGWNGARSFTATSGPGVSLMTEFLGLAYFAEIPVVLMNVQRAGPSTGMPTRTQQSDITACAYASHGDTKQVLLFPSTPNECFNMSADSFDLAERLQTPIMVMSDLDLGMNDHLTEELSWDDDRTYDRGKVLNAQQLEEVEEFGRYLDVDDDGICYRTYPGTHPEKGIFFTRGTSRDEYAAYTEKGDAYVRNMERLEKKFRTAAEIIPQPQMHEYNSGSKVGVIYYGTTDCAMTETLDILGSKGYSVDAMRIRAFPFGKAVEEFVSSHDQVFVVEQNRDGQMRSLLINELEVDPAKMVKVTHYDGMPITADFISTSILDKIVIKPAKKAKRG
ncbi:2-ketoglutarate: nadp oxidoreductase, alpha subunit [Candidatus Terasakiella magnetica]|uniref:2-ketoglutarate: nadp oxidoreductase, alpha subunit n=1 Tax=Candidatus Terasakiella magnetica TaxID=1867952 RepID=A0A1C3RCZ9_9PROT|nr:2-oxoacid:acceptor oxidoreductase subunit alpha [Candidatus Terasakiella magnetica]SCA55153.1 2-ketoglutarate: nadp oxidoreductase, alpha subunit [Candidatus Terasakiella magnetica]